MSLLTEEKMQELENIQKKLICNKSVVFTVTMCDCTGWCYGDCHGDCQGGCYGENEGKYY